MLEAVHAAFTTSLGESEGLPADIQYMPPGRHRIHASCSGKPVTLDIAVDAATADALNDFLQTVCPSEVPFRRSISSCCRSATASLRDLKFFRMRSPLSVPESRQTSAPLGLVNRVILKCFRHRICQSKMVNPPENAINNGAGGGNRTPITSLEGWGFTTKLRPPVVPGRPLEGRESE